MKPYSGYILLKKRSLIEKCGNILSCRKVYEEHRFVPAENIKYPTSCSIRRDRSTLFVYFWKMQSAVCVLWGFGLMEVFEMDIASGCLLEKFPAVSCANGIIWIFCNDESCSYRRVWTMSGFP
jgi:hypothetical protein